MTAETQSLVPEILRRMQASLSRVEAVVSGLGSDIRGLVSHMAGFMQPEFRQDTDLAQIRQRLDRIERRLELGD